MKILENRLKRIRLVLRQKFSILKDRVRGETANAQLVRYDKGLSIIPLCKVKPRLRRPASVLIAFGERSLNHDSGFAFQGEENLGEGVGNSDAIGGFSIPSPSNHISGV